MTSIEALATPPATDTAEIDAHDDALDSTVLTTLSEFLTNHSTDQQRWNFYTLLDINNDSYIQLVQKGGGFNMHCFGLCTLISNQSIIELANSLSLDCFYTAPKDETSPSVYEFYPINDELE